jgi:hypothetical protein
MQIAKFWMANWHLHVKSWPLADEAKVVILTNVVKQTLVLSAIVSTALGLQATHNPPMAKQAIIPHLLFFDNVNRYSSGIGKISM